MRKSVIWLVSSFVIVSLILGGCETTPSTTATSSQTTSATTHPPASTHTVTPAPTKTETPTQTPVETTTPSDTTPPSVITDLIANNAYDGKLNVWWNMSTAEDFDHYNVYLDTVEIVDVIDMQPITEINDIAICEYQATGLENGTAYYLAITAVDSNGNENIHVKSVNATPIQMPEGTIDPDFMVDVYQTDKAWAGTTLLPDNHVRERPRIIEINMLGEIIWEYVLPDDLKQYTNPGFDAELLPNNNVLFLLPGKGIYEIDRSGQVVWSYLDPKVSHDADRLPNGNTIYAFGGNDQKTDAQVKEINPQGEIVWSWYARDYFDKPPYDTIYRDGWTHTNAVSRLANGNTLISPRNFDLLVEVDPSGEVINIYGEGIFIDQHDPEILDNGNILLANHGSPHLAIEFDPQTGEIVWQSPGFEQSETPVRDANRLPNGNTLITASNKIVEVTADGEIVWQLILKDITFMGPEAAALGFYKAERIYTRT